MLESVYEEAHEDFRASVREFALREIWPHVDTFAEQRSLSRNLWRAAGENGYLGLEIPEEYGGSAAQDYRYNAVLIEELAKVNLALASSLSIHFDVVVPYLVSMTTEAQRKRLLPKAATGEMILAIAMTEPSAGSDLAALSTTATPSGDGWVLNGQKTFITNGFSADLVLVAARTTPGLRAKGISLFAVDTSIAGFSRGRKLDKIGQPEADTAELFFDDAFVPAEALIGTQDNGFIHMMDALPQERIGAAVSNLAQVRQILDETLTYARERQAFGKPIGTFQHNKFLLAELVTRVEVTQAYVDQCVLAHSKGRLSATEAAKAKWWTAEVQNAILDHCVQLHGGYGFMREQRVGRAWCDARVTKIWAGSNEIMKEIIGRELGL